MDDIILISLKKNELVSIIEEAIRKANQKDLLNFKEAKELLQVSSSTLNRWKAEDKIPYYRFEGRIYFKREEILKVIVNEQK